MQGRTCSAFSVRFRKQSISSKNHPFEFTLWTVCRWHVADILDMEKALTAYEDHFNTMPLA